jgi:hypothetical protein
MPDGSSEPGEEIKKADVAHDIGIIFDYLPALKRSELRDLTKSRRAKRAALAKARRNDLVVFQTLNVMYEISHTLHAAG